MRHRTLLGVDRSTGVQRASCACRRLGERLRRVSAPTRPGVARAEARPPGLTHRGRDVARSRRQPCGVRPRRRGSESPGPTGRQVSRAVEAAAGRRLQGPGGRPSSLSLTGARGRRVRRPRRSPGVARAAGRGGGVRLFGSSRRQPEVFSPFVPAEVARRWRGHSWNKAPGADRLRRPPLPLRRLRRELLRNRRAPVCARAVKATRSEGLRVRTPVRVDARHRGPLQGAHRSTGRHAAVTPGRPVDAPGAPGDARCPRTTRHRRAYGTGASADRGRAGGAVRWRAAAAWAGLRDAPLLPRSPCRWPCIAARKCLVPLVLRSCER